VSFTSLSIPDSSSGNWPLIYLFVASVRERARKAEKFKADRKASDDAKRLETATRLREEARIPAYGSQIEDCQTIIDFL